MAAKLTPMMEQYRRIKAGLPEEIILLFRLGDFYEMFFDDAKTAAPVLDIALTKRNKVPMCGVPHHALDSYLAKLVRAGLKIAICDQVEDANAAKGIVRREVTRIVTPGTVTEDNILESKRNHFLAGICQAGGEFGLAMLDLSTGLFCAESFQSRDALLDSLKRVGPSECIVPAGQADGQEFDGFMDESVSFHLTRCEDWTFEYDAAYDRAVRHFNVHSMEGFGCEGSRAIIGSAGAVLHYVREDLHREVSHIRSFSVRNSAEYLLLDDATCGNLDLVSLPGRAAQHTLLGILDVTRTAMGGRALREWLLRPPANLDEINGRHDAVEALCKDRFALREASELLGQIRDLERMIARTGAGTGSARDLVAISQSLAATPAIRALVRGLPSPKLKDLGDDIVELPGLVKRIRETLVDEPPATLKDGGVIVAGYSPELDELREAATKGRKWLAEYQAEEQQRTGIKTLKVRHNKVFGYYIEVSKAQAGSVPDNYVRKQTLVNAERFITPVLKEHENRIFGAHERAIALEQSLFAGVRDEVVAETANIQKTARAIAGLDCLAALADRAAALSYVRPRMTAGDRIRIRDGRHPVVEQMPNAERFVSNDTLVDCDQNQLLIITGPNMAGKSTYIRQVALSVVMAQAGSFVPAAEAEIGVVDRVFTRVGASDDLMRGRSTFMVEMQETANILNNATPKSLIVLDEIGRGTSTFDGISIAWAVAEYLHNIPAMKAKTLFATHYHELTDLAGTMHGVKNYNILVREQNDRVVFLRRIVPGGADKSYGIQVAMLAGMPIEVVDRAKEILSNLEEGEFGESGQPKIARRRPKKSKAPGSQMEFF